MKTENSWRGRIVKSILLDKDFDISEVSNFEQIQSLLFDHEKYPAITSLIKDNKLDSLKEYDSEKKDDFREYLHIARFSDQNNKTYVVTIYDSDALWQDPQIIDIISLSEQLPPHH